MEKNNEMTVKLLVSLTLRDKHWSTQILRDLLDSEQPVIDELKNYLPHDEHKSLDDTYKTYLKNKHYDWSEASSPWWDEVNKLLYKYEKNKFGSPE